MSFYVRLVVDQIDVCDIIILCKIWAVFIYIILLVARPNCSVVNVLLCIKYILFKPTKGIIHVRQQMFVTCVSAERGFRGGRGGRVEGVGAGGRREGGGEGRGRG